MAIGEPRRLGRDNEPIATCAAALLGSETWVVIEEQLRSKRLIAVGFDLEVNVLGQRAARVAARPDPEPAMWRLPLEGQAEIIDVIL
jgi:hypothetical protein